MAEFNVVETKQLFSSRLDAEYYKVEYYKIIRELSNLGATPIVNFISKNSMRFSKDCDTFKYIEISGVNLETGEYSTRTIQCSETPSRASFVVQKGDILVSNVRPNRNAVAFINSSETIQVCSSGFTVLRPIGVSSEYIFAYLKVDFSKKLLTRSVSATMYPAINASDVYNLPLLRDAKLEEIIENKIKNGFDSLNHSKNLYDNARAIVRRKVFGQNSTHKTKPKYAEFTLSETNRSNRLDSEYFIHEMQDEPLSNVAWIPLNEVIDNIFNGKTPAASDYSEDGISIIKVEDLQNYGIINSTKSFVPKSWAEVNAKGRVKQKDILMLCAAHHIRYIGKTNIILDEYDDWVSAVGELIVIRPNKKINPEYLSIALRLPKVKEQIQRLTRGNTAHVYPKDLMKLKVPILNDELQLEISELVLNSFHERRKGQSLINQAIHEIELFAAQPNSSF